MLNKKIITVAALGFCLLTAGTQTACGWILLPTAKNRAESRFRQADRLLAQADSLYEKGKPDQALAFYKKALVEFEELNDKVPELYDGLPRYRIQYCDSQMAGLTGRMVDSSDTNAVMRLRRDLAREQTRSDRGAVPTREPQPEPDSEAEEPDTATARNADGTPDISIGEDETNSEPDMELVESDINRARKLLKDNQLNGATRILSAVVREVPDNSTARLLLAIARIKETHYDEALSALDNIPGRDSNLALLLAFAAAHCGKGNYFDAMLALDQAIELAPTDPRAYCNLAWLHLVQGRGAEDFRNAEAYYRQAVRLGAERDRSLEIRLGL